MTTAAVTGLAPDPDLPARDILLDAWSAAERLVPRLGIAGPVEITDARLARAKYRIGESLRVVLRLTVDGVDTTLVARMFRDGASEPAYVRARAVCIPTGPLRPVVLDSELDTVWWTLPNDRRLRGLPELLAPTEQMAFIGGLGGGWRRSELVEFAPERSATVRALDESGDAVAYAKLYAPGSVDVAALGRRYDRVAAALGSVDGLSAPRALGGSDTRDLLVLEAMPGEHWSGLAPARLAPVLRQLGLAIATVHGLDARGWGLGSFGRLSIERVVHSAQLVAAALPQHAAAAERLARALATHAPASGAVVLLHGDCHPKNALVDGAALALIDLDQGALGAPAADIGSLLARLHQGEVLGAHDAAVTESLAGEFLDGYGGAAMRPTGDSLRWHTAAAIVAERALRAVNRVNRPAIEATGDLLARAETVLRLRVAR